VTELTPEHASEKCQIDLSLLSPLDYPLHLHRKHWRNRM
jgi:hypothetical protein